MFLYIIFPNIIPVISLCKIQVMVFTDWFSACSILSFLCLFTLLYTFTHLVHDLPHALLTRKQHDLMSASLQPGKDTAQPLVVVH